MSERLHTWPALVYKDLAPMIDYVNRVVQVAGKYTLDEPFEVGWGNIVLEVTPRGLSTPTFRQGGVTFVVHYRLLDGDVVIESDSGSRTLPLSKGSVAAFFASFCAAAAELGVHRPHSSLICEIPDAPPTFRDDQVERTWDGDAARLMWTALDLAADGLEAWQAPFLGHRPRVGVMWGGFDLSATRWRAQPTTPPPHAPPFQQNAQLDAYVSVGFSFGDAKAPNAGMYAYIWPQPDGLEGRSWGVEGAAWHPDAGLVQLPWDKLRETPDPHQAIVAFGDAVYEAAVETAGWPSDLVGPRVDGWYMSRTPPELVEH
ncbi:MULTISPECIES: DUF5996 family protein [Streptomyces]|uniref:DUF317 domain-containing protein n=1 Tax=Streptomyces dengpaensis TaxID=2049881 RepID=A0ABM6SV88_9ACTN|nr:MULTISPECIES: DUF5996 family protein [Streptomyces]AVH58630.1 hypothetical protein C4B68_25915 [Streptomyces dengpaensis]PIB11310.1 hypothetical protein B1C81_05720 [Streptomyces sp. HG99]